MLKHVLLPTISNDTSFNESLIDTDSLLSNDLDSLLSNEIVSFAHSEITEKKEKQITERVLHIKF